MSRSRKNSIASSSNNNIVSSWYDHFDSRSTVSSSTSSRKSRSKFLSAIPQSVPRRVSVRSTASVVSNLTEALASYWSRTKKIKTKASLNEALFYLPRKSSGSVSCFTSGLSSSSTNASTKSITSSTTDSSSTDYSLLKKLRYRKICIARHNIGFVYYLEMLYSCRGLSVASRNLLHAVVTTE